MQTDEEFTDVSSHVSRTEAFLNKLDDLTVFWLYHFLAVEHKTVGEFGIKPMNLEAQSLSATNLRNVILNCYREDHHFKERVTQAKDALLLTGNDLKWINTADERLCNWLIYILPRDPTGPFYSPATVASPPATVAPPATAAPVAPLSYLPNPPVFDFPYPRSKYPAPPLGPRPAKQKIEDITHSLNCWTTNRTIKAKYLESLMCDWFQTTLIDKHLKWLDRENLEQCAWAWNYLEAKSLAPIYFAPLENRGYYTSVMSVLDSLIPSLTEKQTLANSLRNAWAKQARRAGKDGIRQFNCELTARQRDKLDDIAAAMGTSASKAIAALIEFEYDKQVSLGNIRPR